MLKRTSQLAIMFGSGRIYVYKKCKFLLVILIMMGILQLPCTGSRMITFYAHLEFQH